MIEKIISRGIKGPEIKALALARAMGMETGGQTCYASHQSAAQADALVRNYGLVANECSLREAAIRNCHAADGTLNFGADDAKLERLLFKADLVCFDFRSYFTREDGAHFVDIPNQVPVKEVALWVRAHRIRTLNVVGPSDIFAELCLVGFFSALLDRCAARRDCLG